jgi:ankyrin repeat protein
LNVNPKAKDKIHQTAIYYAAREGKLKVCNYLLDQGVALNEIDVYNQTPVYYAAREGRKEIVQLFAERGADLNLIDKYGQTCVFYAIREGHFDVVDYILSNPTFTSINKADKKGMSLYVFAIKYNKNNIAELLSRKGALASITTKNNDKKLKPKKQSSKPEEEKVEEDVQKPKRYLLCRVNDAGDKIPLTLSEIEEFEQQNPEIAEYMNNPELLEELERNAPEE